MRRSQMLLVMLSVLALVVTGCGNRNKDTGFPDPSPKPSGALPEGAIDVFDSGYEPKERTVKVGEAVLWFQTGSAPHSVTSDTGEPLDSHPDCLEDTSTCMGKGDSFEFTFDKAGEYPYYCVIHGAPGGVNMAGTIIVEA